MRLRYSTGIAISASYPAAVKRQALFKSFGSAERREGAGTGGAEEAESDGETRANRKLA
jgi:hypothetical protein